MRSSEIAQFLNKELIGEDIDVNNCSSLSSIQENTVIFVNKYSAKYIDLLDPSQKVLAIVCPGYEGLKVSHVVSPNPRLDFIRIVDKYFTKKDFPTGVHETAVVDKGAKLGSGVTIGAHCYIGPNVIIGDDTEVLHNCSIYGNTRIGNNCRIKPGAVIGAEGNASEFDENGIPVHFPHKGGVIIGNNVYIGANTIVDRATIDNTIIGDNVKIDSLVLVGHNSIIKDNAVIIGGAVICGSVQVGEKAWIAPNATIHQKLTVGNNSLVGIGSVVLTNVKEGDKVFGVPAKRLLLGKKKNK